MVTASAEVTEEIRRKCALYRSAVSHFPAKGGEAYGKKAREDTPALPDMLHHYPCGNGLHIPKSVLAARLRPERLTVS